MAGEIVIPISIWPNHVTNANGVVRPVAMDEQPARPEAQFFHGFVGLPLACERADQESLRRTGRFVWVHEQLNTSSTLRIITRAIARCEHDEHDPSSWTTTVNLDDISNGQA